MTFGCKTIALPPVNPADKLFDYEAKLGHIECAFGGSVAADTVAVGNVEKIFVQIHRCFLSHGSVRNVDGAGNMFFGESFRCARVDDDYILASVESIE